jgi:hypothetical protein
MAAPAGSVAETRPTRRDVLRAAGAVAGAWALAPAAAPRAEPAVARYRRRNVTDPAAARMLESYKRAIRTMLALPPEDPRNWYRIALVHTVDCPHGNWWFLPWHRGYVGSVERICREVSGDPDFAFPYWDWTELPRVPNPLFDDVLTPTNPAFIATARDFRARFEAAVAAAPWWRRSEPFDAKTPYGQLLARGIRMPEDLWFDINDDPRGRLFFDRANARGPTREQPELDGRTRKAVSRALLLDALAPRDFATFASPKAASHDVLAGFGVLEGQPHKRIHNCLGGVMTDAAGKVTDRGGFM